MKKNNVIINPCDNRKCMQINKCACSNQGICLVVPVSIHSICKNSHLLVIVEVYKDKKLYSRKIKEVFTDSINEDNLDCCSDNSLIDSLFIDNFKFYFINVFNPKCIHIEVNTQYIYDC